MESRIHVERVEAPAATALELPQDLNTDAVNALLEVLRSVELAGEAHVDARNVQRVGTPGIQLLVSAARTFEERGARFLLLEPSEALREACRITGASALLGIED